MLRDLTKEVADKSARCSGIETDFAPPGCIMPALAIDTPAVSLDAMAAVVR